ncbi:hypothetical protein Ciccas_008454 [Cichlidogyrus casuarinus]|uniref:B30.2/SPRY domain-containing protein n=1 Tax=Cichlidogyrus casuarinus TaxID=1844966 RepID=A0ABD2Q0R8_9PLAT
MASDAAPALVNNNNQSECPQSAPDSNREWPPRLDALFKLPSPPLNAQMAAAWNPGDASEHIFVQDGDPFTFHRHPTAQSTDAIRGRLGYSKGVHLWEVSWHHQQRGTHAVVGISTREAPLHTHGYQSLIGNNDQSWGWDITRCRALHDARRLGWRPYPSGSGGTSQSNSNTEPSFRVPQLIYVILDMDEGTLSFAVEKQFLGVAFDGLRGKVLFPAVSAVWGHCEVTMHYLGGLDTGPLSLMQSCRRAIWRHMQKSLAATTTEENNNGTGGNFELLSWLDRYLPVFVNFFPGAAQGTVRGGKRSGEVTPLPVAAKLIAPPDGDVVRGFI